MLTKPEELILTAGPANSRNEVKYVVDATMRGWNFHHSDYIVKFEKAFASYLGCKYALTMPTGTSALHLALVLFGVKAGDEVIIPDLTYVACANVIHYIGAKAVLAEVDRQTWSLDAEKLEKYITPKTRAIMPVHLYGNMADMGGIKRIAKKHHLRVLEDACEGLGCIYYGKPAGTLSDAAAFSFQGAKLLAIGEGGMFVTNKKDWYERARSLVDHGVSFKHQFWHNEIGFMYPMSNIQAALGLARLEEINWSIERKRRIFKWYYDRLHDIPGITLNPSRPGLHSSYWMSSLVLDKKFPLSRNQLRWKLREQKIDTRPFFYPISMFNLYGKRHKQHPVAYHLGLNGINLPSGVMLTEEKIDYVVRCLRQNLRV